ncbi:hypothetical protein [Nostoc sp. FACHB-152]|uniref:hypothetical protein n=1 Tax=Nostoc sp. FACHB-152 TaxID=2692837 RepID=UPI001684B76F|nr:hypothetical protein [Nostoc sp. FACHB-152]
MPTIFYKKYSSPCQINIIEDKFTAIAAILIVVTSFLPAYLGRYRYTYTGTYFG